MKQEEAVKGEGEEGLKHSKNVKTRSKESREGEAAWKQGDEWRSAAAHRKREKEEDDEEKAGTNVSTDWRPT